MKASRLPGKPLIPLFGIPMLGHCYFRTKMASLVRKTYIATCDREIEKYARQIGACFIPTSRRHRRATTRTAEALETISKKKLSKSDIVVMVQGDEPLITPNAINKLIRAFENPRVEVANIMSPIKSHKAFHDHNNVKVVFDRSFNALYFSRAAIPCTWSQNKPSPHFMQTGVIAFRKKSLFKFLKTKESKYEISESIDMNRILEHGGKIKMIPTKKILFGVDTKKDLKLAKYFLKNDPFRKIYS